MRITTYADAREFKAAAWELLLEHEAENNLMVGIVGRLMDGGTSIDIGGTSLPRFWTVQDGRQVLTAAVVTPPYRLTLTPCPSPAVDALCDHLHSSGVELPGIMGPKDAVSRFAARWCQRNQSRLRHVSDMGVYRLDRVQGCPQVPGHMEMAGIDQLELMLKWGDGFARDVHLDHPPDRERILHLIQSGSRFVWRDGDLVSMAGATGATPNGIRINSVYTPDEHRRHGYASALVAALSQRQLDAGRRFCFLFTDLANPTSNSIYQRIGYQPVSVFGEYSFLPEG